jgi:hypothetical protein
MYQLVGAGRGYGFKFDNVTMGYVHYVWCRQVLFVKMPLNATYRSCSSQ